MNKIIFVVWTILLCLSPVTSQARFSQADTWPGMAYQPLTLNKYTYANVDPVNSIDPSGKFSIGQAIAASSVTGVLTSLATSQYSPFSSMRVEGETGQFHPSIGLNQGEADAVGNIIIGCIKSQYGDDTAPVRQIIEATSFPIYKPLVGMRTMPGASKFLSAFSYFGHVTFKGQRLPIRLQRTLKKTLGTPRATGAAGRLNAVAGAGFAAYDITGIALCINHYL